MLSIDLRDLRQGALEWEETVSEPATVWGDVPAEFRGPVRLRGRAEARGERVHVVGELEARIAVSCRRCLRPVEEDLVIELDIAFRPGAEAGEQGEAVFPLDPQATVLDLRQALREELFLAVPAYPVCRPECGGLCPKCGAVRDEDPCDCVLEEPDSRWDALREIRTG